KVKLVITKCACAITHRLPLIRRLQFAVIMVWSPRGRSSVGGLVRMFGRLALLALLCGRITTPVLRGAAHWDEVVTKLGYEHLRRHDLRHTGLTWMADAGIPVRVQRQIAGHGSLVTTQRYLHPDAQSITDAVTGLSAHLSARWSPKPAITT